MPLYKYRVCDSSGEISELTVEADSKSDSVSRLRVRGVKPLEYIGTSDTDYIRKDFSSIFKSSRFDYYEFTDTLVPLLEAHIPLEVSLGMIAAGSDSDTFKDVVYRIRKGLHEGKKFSDLIRNHGAMFPKIYSNMVEAGEESGALNEVMAELQKFLNDRKELKEFLITSSIYPVIILVVTFGVIALLFTVFIPRFSKLFIDMGKDLPGPTKLLLLVSQTATSLWWLWLIMFIAFVRSVTRGGVAKLWWDNIMVRMPFTSDLVQTMEISRYFRTLGVLVNNHVPILNSITIASKVIHNIPILKSVSSISAGLRGGAKLSQTLSKSKFVPNSAIQMLHVGEESGKLGEMLDLVAARYEKILKTKIKRLLSLFEPFVILGLSFIILLVVVSIFMAILEMSDI